MDMESIPLDINFLGEELQNSSSVPGDQMDFGTFGNLSDTSLPNEICKGSDLFLFNPHSLTTTTNREDMMHTNPFTEPSLSLDSEFLFGGNLYSSPTYSNDFYPLILDKCLSEGQILPNIFNCGNFMKSPLSSEDVDSVLDTASLSDGDTSISPLGSPLSSPLGPAYDESPASCSPPPNEDLSVPRTPSSYLDILVPSTPPPYNETPASSPSPFQVYLIYTKEGNGAQVSNSVQEASAVIAATTTRGATPESDHSCSLVPTPGKEKRPKSYRTKKTPYSWNKSTESIPSPLGIVDQSQQLSKKEKKKLQNKNAATRYRQKMKEEAELQKGEEEELLKENRRLKNRVEEIRKEIQYLKNLREEIAKAGTKL